MFKKLMFLICGVSMYSQVPEFTDAKVNYGSGDDFDSGVALDHSGNTIEIGYFQSATFNIQGVDYARSPLPDFVNYDFADGYVVKYNPDHSVQWRLRTFGAFAERPFSVVVDQSDNIFVAGYYNSDETTFGTISVSNPENYFAKAFLMKISPDGVVQWVKTEVAFMGNFPIFTQASIRNGIRYSCVKTDADGNAYVTGSLSAESVTIGGTTLTNDISSLGSNAVSNVVVVKYNPDGNVMWAKTNAGTGEETTGKHVTDAAGNTYYCGTTSSAQFKFGTTLAASPGQADMLGIFVAKLDTNGEAVWVHRFGGSDLTDYSNDIGVDASGNAIVVGGFRSNSITFGSTTLQNNAQNSGSTVNPDLFIARYDAMGNPTWIITAPNDPNFPAFQENAFEEIDAIEVRPNGCFYVSGNFGWPILLDGQLLTPLIQQFNPPYNKDAFLAKFAADGNIIWSKVYGGLGGNDAADLDVDDSGMLVSAGSYMSSVHGITFDDEIYYGWTINNSFWFDPFVFWLDDSQGICTPLLGTEAPELRMGVKVYPNPAGAAITISSEAIMDEIIIFDMYGREVYQNKPYTTEANVNLLHLSSGVYLISITSDGGKNDLLRFIKE